MKNKTRVLVLYYSYSDKTKILLDMFLEPLRNLESVDVFYEKIELINPVPKPWPFLDFFGAFPEIVHEVPQGIIEPTIELDSKYDLIIYGHQVWFLSPSIPTTSFFNHKKSAVFKDTPVITFMFARKMWHQAQGRVDEFIEKSGGKIIDRVVITAKGSQMKTFMDTRYNLLNRTDENKRSWKAGEEAIEVMIAQGQQLANSINCIDDSQGFPLFTRPSIAFNNEMFVGPERVQKKSFLRWGRFMIKYSRKGSNLRKFIAFIFAFQFISRIILILPFWPVMYKIKTGIFRSPARHEIV
ncbi:MAG: hypothetical protein OEY89_09420 [Gammaproteobacteria bacterium]|nr:hypothetical protein [Gammaproteobacteria bacterium]